MFSITCSSRTDSPSVTQRQSLQNKSVPLNVQLHLSPPRTAHLLCSGAQGSLSAQSPDVSCQQQREPTLYRKGFSFSLEHKAEHTITVFFATQYVLTDEALISLIHLRCCKFLLYYGTICRDSLGENHSKLGGELGLLSCLCRVLNHILSHT